MDEQKKDRFKLPIEWIDRIFKRLVEIYGDEFATRFNNPTYLDLERLRWQSGLFGATPEEIKRVIELCRLGQIKSPPNVVEFYHYCKGYKQPIPPKPEPYATPINRELGQKYIQLIRDKLHGRLDSQGQATLSALNQQVLDKQKPKVKDHWQDN